MLAGGGPESTRVSHFLSSFPLTATFRTIVLSSETREPRMCAPSCGFSESVLRFTYECRALCRGFVRLTIPPTYRTTMPTASCRRWGWCGFESWLAAIRTSTRSRISASWGSPAERFRHGFYTVSAYFRRLIYGRSVYRRHHEYRDTPRSPDEPGTVGCCRG